MAPPKKSDNSGGNNPHMTKRKRFNANTNVPVSHSGCQIAVRSKIDRERHQTEGSYVKIYVSRAKGIFHINLENGGQ